MEMNTTTTCYCPGDCGCRTPWRRNVCGCRAHDGATTTDTLTEALAAAALAAEANQAGAYDHHLATTPCLNCSAPVVKLNGHAVNPYTNGLDAATCDYTTPHRSNRSY